jgi:hypothetical protein
MDDCTVLAGGWPVAFVPTGQVLPVGRNGSGRTG